MINEHHWSGWPGAYCLHCFADDPLELAVADNRYDPITNTWSSEEENRLYEEASICKADRDAIKDCYLCNFR